MLQIGPTSKIYLASTHIDFRKGIDGIAAICRNKINIDPLDGAIFLFYNRSTSAIKILVYDGQGFWLCSKRLSSGTFKWNLPKNFFNQNLTAYQICHKLISVLINNGQYTQFPNDWRQVQ